MRLGVCTGPEGSKSALAAGAEYLEVAGGRLVRDEAYREEVRRLPVEATNLFFAQDVRLYADEAGARVFGEAVVRYASEFGASVCVVGSGGVRRAPEGWVPALAEQCFVRFVGELAPYARALGVALAPESLNREETDVGNDLARLANALQAFGAPYTADSYHVLKEWDAEGREGSREAPSDVLWMAQIPHLPAHVHLGPLARNAPQADDDMLAGFFRRLKELGYDGRISLECAWGDFDLEIGPALEASRRLWEAA